MKINILILTNALEENDYEKIDAFLNTNDSSEFTEEETKEIENVAFHSDINGATYNKIYEWLFHDS